MNNITLSADKEEKFSQLLSLINTNVSCCENILTFISSKNNDALSYTKFINTDIGTYLISVCNNHFFLAVLMFHSLLYPYNEKELSPYNFDPSEAIKIKLNYFREIFKNNNFHTLRHRAISHRDESYLLNPLYVAIVPMDRNYFNSFKNLYNEFEKWVYETYDITHFINQHKIQRGSQLVLETIDKLNLDAEVD